MAPVSSSFKENKANGKYKEKKTINLQRKVINTKGEMEMKTSWWWMRDSNKAVRENSRRRRTMDVLKVNTSLAY